MVVVVYSVVVIDEHAGKSELRTQVTEDSVFRTVGLFLFDRPQPLLFS